MSQVADTPKLPNPGNPTLSALVGAHAQGPNSARPAYRWTDLAGDDHELTWAQYHHTANQVAGALRARGAAAGDRVLVLLPDSGTLHAAYVGCERSGCIPVGLGYRSGPQEIQHLAERTQPIMCITTDEAPVDLPGIPVVTFAQLLEGPIGTNDGTAIGPDNLWFLNSTSGTTGLPKLVQQTQRRWFWFHTKAAEYGQLTAADTLMSVVPAPFGFGLWTSHFTPTILGTTCVVQSRFDAARAATQIQQLGVTVLAAVSSQFVMILDAASGQDLSSLRVMFTGGERISASRAREFEDRTGCTILNFYGSNETGMLSGTRIGDPLEQRLTTGGRCVPEMQVRLYDQDGNRVPGDIGQGRPAAKGPTLSPGYYDDPEADQELFTDDGWMLMGDIVQIDDEGWLTVVGRTADFIIRGGKNISAASVEEEVGTHPAVAHVAAVAVPDQRLGEKVGVFVELLPGTAGLELHQLTVHLEDRGVTKQWWPEYLVVLPELPRAPGGKIAKGQLREHATKLA